MVQRGDEEPRRDADAFRHIVVLVARAVGKFAPALGEDDDEPGRDGEMGFFRRRPDGFQRLDPFVAAAARVEGAFLDFRLFADARLERGVTDRHEMPWLVVGPRGGRPGGADAVLDHLAGNGSGEEVAHRMSCAHAVEEAACGGAAVFIRHLDPVGQGDRGIGHGIAREHRQLLFRSRSCRAKGACCARWGPLDTAHAGR